MNRLSNGWRLVGSFVAAFILWTFVTLTQNPEDHKLFDVPLQIKNLPANMVVIDENGVVAARTKNICGSPFAVALLKSTTACKSTSRI